jgi:cephalosporin-C deacetylase-like acetyl esterase
MKTTFNHPLFSQGKFILGFLVTASFLIAHAQAASSWDGKKPDEFVITVEPDKADAIYHQGEVVTFNIDMQDNKQPAADGTNVDWTLTKDGVQPPLQTGTATLQGGKATITGTMTEPGFLRCEVTYKKDKDTFVAPAAAAIDPDQIKPSMPVPDDFDAFWDAKKKALAAVPINAKLTPVDVPAVYQSNGPLEGFELQADCIGNPASGYYVRPAGAKPKSCPAILYVEGAGIRSAEVGVAARWANKGFLSIDLNAHGLPNGKPREFYDDLAKGDLKDYKKMGIESRDTYYFLGMYLRDLRAIDFLTSQPEWDGHTLIVQGVSQGGGQSFAVTGLDPRVSYMVAGLPALTDLTGAVAGRIAGWPRSIPAGADGKPDAAAVETSRYFDGVNMASRIKVPVYLYIGFVDNITPPTCSFAAANAITSKKQIVNGTDYGHLRDAPGFWPTFNQVVVDAALAQGAQVKGATATPTVAPSQGTSKDTP